MTNRAFIAALLVPGLAFALIVSCAFAVRERDVVHSAFLGDSLTEDWNLPIHNYGVHGQTSGQIDQRMPGSYRNIYLLAGTNDVILGVPPATTLAHIQDMVTKARSRGEHIVLATIPPIHIHHDAYRTAVVTLNNSILLYGRQSHLTVIDYYHALEHHPEAQSDGIHMRRRGYLYMDAAFLLASFTPAPSR